MTSVPPPSSRKLRLPPRRLVLWHAVAAVPLGLVVVLGAFLSYHYHTLARENRNSVDRAYEVLETVDTLFAAVQSADIAERGFIITGNPSHLDSFQNVLQAERRADLRLRALFDDSPAQARDLARLDLAVAVKLAELGQGITLRQARGFDAARGVIEQEERVHPMAEIRRQVGALADAEHAFLMRRQEIARRRERETVLTGALLAALSVTIRVLIAVGLTAWHRREQEAARASQRPGLL